MPGNDAPTKALLTERKQLREEMRAMVEAKAKETANNIDTESGVVMQSERYTAEETDKHNRLVARWGQIEEALGILESEADQDRIASERADLVAGATVASNNAKLNAEAFKNLISVGRNTFTAKRVPEQGHPGEWELAAPAIIKGSDGKNRVHPFPAVYNDRNGGTVDVEASFRNAEMIKAGVAGQYDPLTGMRLDAAADPIRQPDVPASIPDLVVDLYRYMITRNELAQYCRVFQTAGLNDLPIQRRTAVPKATIVGPGTDPAYGENTDIGFQQSDFDETELKAFKYAFISQYSYEAAMSVEPWSIAAQVVEDGGIGLANGFGEHVLIGNGPAHATAKQPQGILTAIKANSGQQVTGVAAATAFTGARNARTFGIDQFTNFLTSLSIPYFKSPNLRLITGIAAWGNLLSVTDTNGQPIFNANMNVKDMTLPKFGLSVSLDQNMESVAQNNYPFVIGDLNGHAVRYAGGVRIDFSSEFGWRKDLLSYKFVMYGDAVQIDINAFKGYRLT